MSRPGFDTSVAAPGWASTRSTTSSPPCRRAAPDAGRGDPRRRGRPGEDDRGRSGALRAADARARRPGTGHHPGRAGRSVARGAGTQVRPAHRRSPARRLGARRRPIGGARVAGRRPARSAALRADRQRVGPRDRRRGAPAAEPAPAPRASSPATCAPATCCCSPPPRWRTGWPTSTSWSTWSRRDCWARPAQFRRAHGADTDARGAAQRRRAARPHPRGDGAAPAQRGRGAASPPRLAETVLVTPCARRGGALRRHRRADPGGGRGATGVAAGSRCAR